MNKASRLYYLVKEIGIPQLGEYAVYQAAKKFGWVAKQTPVGGIPLDFDIEQFDPKLRFDIPNKDALESVGIDHKKVIDNAEEIVNGSFHPFSGEKTPLSFIRSMDTEHWLTIGDTLDRQDIKWIWEPARFTWALDLARAYLIRPDDRYAEFFWERFTEFNQLAPVNCGPYWSSAQECALRLLAWTLVIKVFKSSPATTPDRMQRLSISMWQHAARIPPTLAYARSQNNNHHLSEALGLIVAGSIFAEKSQAAQKWKKLGIREFNRGLLNQIEPDGTYGQHSANYHRLMIQLSLIYYSYAKHINFKIPEMVSERLAASTLWMAAQMDQLSGRLPNLGHNDGTLLLPMGCEDYRDYRPTIQAASRAFLGQPCLPQGQWDELSLWVGLSIEKKTTNPVLLLSTAVHKIISENSWATLRSVRFHGRPAHADQLHLDLWWDGINIAQDAGTYSYNDPQPWQNVLSSSIVHNTVTINDKDQMQRASKFLWLDQAQARWSITGDRNVLTACHNGYRRFGVIHQRTMEFEGTNHLLVTDVIHRTKSANEISITLHWLLPVWGWKLEGQTLALEQDHRKVLINISASDLMTQNAVTAADLSIIRGGVTLQGQRSNPILGWTSNTYGSKESALSFSIIFKVNNELQILSDWNFTKSPEEFKG